MAERPTVRALLVDVDPASIRAVKLTGSDWEQVSTWIGSEGTGGNQVLTYATPDNLTRRVLAAEVVGLATG